MALITARQTGFKQAAAPAVRRTRVVKVAAVQQKGVNLGSAVAAAAAAVLLVSCSLELCGSCYQCDVTACTLRSSLAAEVLVL